MRQLTKHLFLVVLFAASACTRTENNFNGKTVFRYNEVANISSLDPAFARSHENIWAVNHLYSGLLKMGNNLKVEPQLAKHYSVSESGKEYTFYLRTDVYFHEHSLFGSAKTRKVTAQDFVYSFNRIIDPETASPGRWVFDKVSDDINAFEALNDSVLKIKLKKPWPVFLSVLTMQYCSVVPREIVEFHGKDFRSNPIGTGPFKLFLWKENTRLVLHKNENYFEVDSVLGKLPLLDAVSISFNQDVKSVFLGFLKNEYDLISGLDASFKDEILTASGALKQSFSKTFGLNKGAFLKTDYLGFLLSDSSITTDVNFRKAINFAINKEKMVKYLRNNIGTAASKGFIPKGLLGFNQNANYGYTFNVDSAKYYLSKSSYKGQILALSATANQADLCEYVQKELQKVGIKLKIDILPASHHREQTSKGNLQFFRKNWLADYPDAENFLAVFLSKNHPPNGPNYVRFSNNYYDTLYQIAMLENNLEKRISYYGKLDSILMQNAVIVPLYYDEVVQLVSNRVNNLKVSPINLLDLSRVSINP